MRANLLRSVREFEPALFEEVGQAVAVVALEFDPSVRNRSTSGEFALEVGSEVGDVRRGVVEPLDDGHRLAVAALVDADRDPLVGAREVAVDIEFVGQSRDRVEVA